MRITLMQSPYAGSIVIRIESTYTCTQIYTSSVFDPYEELYIWLGQVRDSQLPATVIIDEEGRGVELIAERASNNLIHFRIEPWFCGNDTITRLTTVIEPYELLQAFHNGIIQFIKNDYRPSDWSYINDLRNINWGALLKPPRFPSQDWQKRLAMYRGGHGRVPETGLDTVKKQLTLEQQWLIFLRDVLIKISLLSARHQTNQVQVLANLYKTLPIDIALSEVDPNWYEERRAELDTEYGLSRCLRPANRYERERYCNLKKARLETLKVGQIVDGTVRGIKPYGVFVDIGGYHALLHISAISQLPVEHPEQVFIYNDWVRAIVVWLDIEKGRISLSTSDLEPEPGDMLKNPVIVYEKAEEMAVRYRELVLSRQKTE